MAARWSDRSLSDFLALGLWCGVFSLAAAGVLKIATGLRDDSPIAIWLGIAELVFLGVLFGTRREHLRCALLLAVFTGLAAISAIYSLTNAPSCGCLGFIRIAPIAMFTFDVLVVLAAGAALVQCNRSRTRFFEGVTACVGRCVCAGLLLASVTSLVIANDAARLAGQADASFEVLQERAHDINNAFVFDLQDGDWDITVLRQSCPTCQELLAQGHGKNDPLLVAIFVDDVFAFYAEELTSGVTSLLAPIITDASFDNVVTPSRMRMRNGHVVEFRSLVQTEGV